MTVFVCVCGLWILQRWISLASPIWFPFTVKLLICTEMANNQIGEGYIYFFKRNHHRGKNHVHKMEGRHPPLSLKCSQRRIRQLRVKITSAFFQIIYESGSESDNEERDNSEEAVVVEDSDAQSDTGIGIIAIFNKDNLVISYTASVICQRTVIYNTVCKRRKICDKPLSTCHIQTLLNFFAFYFNFLNITQYSFQPLHCSPSRKLVVDNVGFIIYNPISLKKLPSILLLQANKSNKVGKKQVDLPCFNFYSYKLKMLPVTKMKVRMEKTIQRKLRFLNFLIFPSKLIYLTSFINGS